MKKFNLGQGLQSLIPTKNVKPVKKTENIFYVEIKKIKPNPNQPRKDFDPKGIKELANSIRKYGLLQPILVSKIEKRKPRGLTVQYQLIAGQRRLKAAKLAGLNSVPVIIKENEEKNNLNNLEMALTENLQRKNLNPIEEAHAFLTLNKEFNLTHKEIAQKIGKSREYVSNSIRLLDLPEFIKQSLIRGEISPAHAKTLLMIEDKNKLREIHNILLKEKITTHQLERIASRINKHKRKKIKKPRLEDIEKDLANILNTKVAINLSKRGQGKLTIDFKSSKDLNKIVKKILT